MKFFKATDPWGTYFWRITDDEVVQLRSAHDGAWGNQSVIKDEAGLRAMYDKANRDPDDQFGEFAIEEITEDQVGEG